MSVVGVGRVAGEIASLDDDPARVEGGRPHRHRSRSLNIALFVFNLIPLLPLDGGHIAGALWEGIRRTFAEALPATRPRARRHGQAHAAHARGRRDPRRHERCCSSTPTSSSRSRSSDADGAADDPPVKHC